MPTETTPQALTVRTASLSELSLLLSGEKTVFSDPWGEEACRSQLLADYGYALVAFIGDRFAGYLFASLLPPESELFRIAVLPEARRNGVGQLLLSRYLSDAAGEGVTDFFLEVREHNATAHRLYLRNGYQKIGIRRRYYKNPPEDAYLFSRSLKEEDGEG